MSTPGQKMSSPLLDELAYCKIMQKAAGTVLSPFDGTPCDVEVAAHWSYLTACSVRLSGDGTLW